MSTKTTADYLDELQAKLGAPSDYAVAKRMGWRTQQTSRYRLKQNSFDDETCIKVAAALEIDPARIMLHMNAQRARSAEARAAWEALIQRVAAVVILSVTPFAVAPDARAGFDNCRISDHGIHIVSKGGRRQRRDTRSPFRLFLDWTLGRRSDA